MSTKNTGGPAFPLQSIGPDFAPGYSGMALRDYFAAKVMQGFCAAFMNAAIKDQRHFVERMPSIAYEMADAMLAAREAKP